MTIYQPPMQPMEPAPSGNPPPQKLSVSALLSFIAGLLMCIPVSGVLAMIFGAVGISATGAGKKRGRWMAILGLVFGLLATIGWIGTTYFAVTAYHKVLAAFNTSATQFVSDIQAGNFARVTPMMSPTITPMQLADFATKMRPLGSFKEGTITSWKGENTGGETFINMGGTATFDTGGPRVYHIRLRQMPVTGALKIESIDIDPDITLP